jgi:hypothetical protein
MWEDVVVRKSVQETREQLIRAGAEALADELLRLASRHDEADSAVRRLTATSEERLKHYKSGLAGLRRARRFVPWSESRELAARLEGLLEELRTSGCNPKSGADLVGRFFECDESTLGRCDDSSGMIGDVFRVAARDLWVEFASNCEDKEWIVERLEELLADDNYGVRDCLLASGPEYLTEAQLRSLADRFWDRAKQEKPAIPRNRWYLLAGIVARVLVDPALYEKSTVAWCGGEVGGLYLEIARLYAEAGSPTGALRWLQSAQPGRRRRDYEHDQLLLNVYGQLGERDKQGEVAQHIFDGNPSLETLDQLVAVVGENRREALVQDAERRITGGPLSLSGAEFLLDVGRGQTAESHIVAGRSELNGDSYPTLLKLAKRLEAEGLLVSTVCVYRALLESILERGVSKYYHHGVRYLKALDSLAPRVREWNPLESHVVYRTHLLEQHGRKRSFWAKAESAG